MHDYHRMSPEYQEKLRRKINASKLTIQLHNHALGKVEMSQTQVQAALGLLKKVMPELASTEVTGSITHFGDALERMAKRYEVENAAVLTPETPLPEQAPSEDGHAIH